MTNEDYLKWLLSLAEYNKKNVSKHGRENEL